MRRGMTLLEVIVALTIAGSALASGAAVLGFLTDQQAQNGTQTVVSASAVRGTIRAWTSEARLATEGDAEFRGRPGGAPASSVTSMRRADESDELSFVTTAPTEVSATGTIVRLYVASADSARGRGLMAELRPWRRSGAPVTLSLAPDAVGMRVRYLSSLYGRRSWIDSWVTTSVLPAALELSIVYDSTTMRGEDRAARALLSTPVLVALAGRQ
ncbi:MAG: prepilin-type N-terminal cleavage/methylation domain-containing protein [Gemmatimonadaceae bacterium]